MANILGFFKQNLVRCFLVIWQNDRNKFVERYKSFFLIAEFFSLPRIDKNWWKLWSKSFWLDHYLKP